eukprot:TRINITY_DN22300_c0_g2_i1.p1 TRINITY_DN22300_c0_g2~~TRINITY_DN22300_c0_g2_i1.p1  ORF type:complete len:964 (-),score=207.94 TRINITY_DN22300_c0_g2_i1:65-2869(-)
MVSETRIPLRPEDTTAAMTRSPHWPSQRKRGDSGRCRCRRAAGCLALVTSPALCAAQSVSAPAAPPGPTPGRLWPETPSLDDEGLRKRAEDVCARAGVQQRLEAAGFKLLPLAYAEYPGGDASVLASMLRMRELAGEIPSALTHVVHTCGPGVAANAGSHADGAGEDCGSALLRYVMGLAWPFGVPMAAAALSAVCYLVCCFVACCRCCRRMMCCRERMEARYASKFSIVASVVIWIGAFAGILSLGSSVHELSLTAHAALDAHMCAANRLARDTIAGVDRPAFLGVQHGLANLEALTLALDVDGPTQRLIGTVIDATRDFAALQEALTRRIAHFAQVVALSGPAVRVLDHRCVFCTLALGGDLGDGAVAEDEGLLVELEREVRQSSGAAMFSIRQYAETRLTGSNLTSLGERVKRGTHAVRILDNSLRLFAEIWPRQQPSIDAAEWLRLAVFGVQGVAAMAGAALGILAFVVTRVRIRRHPDRDPSGKVHCYTWCCGFCYATGALVLGAAMLFLAVGAGEACIFTRWEIMSDRLSVHADALGLLADEDIRAGGAAAVATSEALARRLVSTCFSANGTGDLLGEAGLSDELAFQSELTSSFLALEDRLVEPPAGRQTAAMLERLRVVAEEFGGLFILDPLPLSSEANGSAALGVLELGSNVRDLLLGSHLEPEDQKGPDARTTHLGLNSYAALIAGPGKYTFEHGTAGGGFVITTDRPSDEELEGVPIAVRNALLYAREKEQLLGSTSHLRCDELLSTGERRIRRCGVRDFRLYVAAEVARIADASAAAAAEAELVRGLFTQELRAELLPTLRQVRDLRKIFNCRQLWQRAEDTYGSLCEDLVPVVVRGSFQLFALATVSLLGVLVQYKVWRHLKDNKVVRGEMIRFEAALVHFEDKVERLNAERRSKEERIAAYRSAVIEGKVAADQEPPHEE